MGSGKLDFELHSRVMWVNCLLWNPQCHFLQVFHLGRSGSQRNTYGSPTVR